MLIAATSIPLSQKRTFLGSSSIFHANCSTQFETTMIVRFVPFRILLTHAMTCLAVTRKTHFQDFIKYPDHIDQSSSVSLRVVGI